MECDAKYIYIYDGKKKTGFEYSDGSVERAFVDDDDDRCVGGEGGVGVRHCMYVCMCMYVCIQICIYVYM